MTTLLTIHVCNGQFLVWDAAVCRALSRDWRVLGESAQRGRPQQQADDDDATPAPDDSDSLFTDSLPMTLQAVQVLLLFLQAPQLLDLVDAGSVDALRADSDREETEGSARRREERVRTFHAEMEAQEAHHARLKQKFQQQRTPTQPSDAAASDGPAAAAASDAATADTANAVEPSSKRAKLGASAAGTSASAASAAPSSAASSLPASSSYRLAADAFPLSASAPLAHSNAHPTTLSVALAFPLQAPPLLLDRRLLSVDLHNLLSRPRSAKQMRLSGQATEQLLFQGLCDSVGLRLHADSCAAAASSFVDPFRSPFALSSAFRSLLSEFALFRFLWSEGFFLLPGLHFGADFVAYEDLPSKVHSTFLVKILPPLDAGDEKQAAADENHLSALEMANLSRMATGVNKTVLVTQAIVPTASDAGAPSSACACVSAFRSAVGRFTDARIESTTLHWNLTAGLARASYPSDHMQRTPARKLAK